MVSNILTDDSKNESFVISTIYDDGGNNFSWMSYLAIEPDPGTIDIFIIDLSFYW